MAREILAVIAAARDVVIGYYPFVQNLFLKIIDLKYREK